MKLQTFSSNSLQVEAIFDSVLDNIKQLLKNKQNILIALSGGRSPIPLLEKLSNSELDFSKITFTLVDERIVATDNKDSNEHLLKTYLLKNNAKNARLIGLVDPDLNNEKILTDANNKIANIDLAILGMGEDGHTASIFPCSKELNKALHDNSNYVITNPETAPYSRISLTLNALINIPVLILSINGGTKLKVVTEANKGDNLNYPISYVLSRRPDTETFWYE